MRVFLAAAFAVIVSAVIVSPALAAELQFQCSLKQRSSSTSAAGHSQYVTGFARKYRLKDGVLYISESVGVRNCTLTDLTIECDSTDIILEKGSRPRTRKRTAKMDRSTGETRMSEAYSGFSGDAATVPDVTSQYSQSGICKPI